MILYYKQWYVTGRQLKQLYPAATEGNWQTLHLMNQWLQLQFPKCTVYNTWKIWSTKASHIQTIFEQGNCTDIADDIVKNSL